MTGDEAAVLLVMAEVALRAVKRDGAPGPGDRYRRVLAGAALSAPRTAAACEEVLKFTGVAERVARALRGSETGAAFVNGAQWMTPAQAAELLGLKPNSVRWLLRHGRLNGKRTECGWRISSGEVARWADRSSATSTC